MPLTVALLVLPAASPTDRMTDWLAPLVLKLTTSGQAAVGMPERVSAQVKLTLTGLTYQPLFPLGAAGETV